MSLIELNERHLTRYCNEKGYKSGYYTYLFIRRMNSKGYEPFHICPGHIIPTKTESIFLKLFGIEIEYGILESRINLIKHKHY
jgi:hypothetical protein